MRLGSFIVILLLILLASVGGCESVMGEEAAIEHYVRGQLLAERGDYDAALIELTKAVTLDSELSVAYAAAGDIYRRLGSYLLACRSYQSACRANPYAFRPHYNLGVTYQALAEAARVFEKMQNYLRQATHVYLRATTIRPNNFEANLNLSACYFQLGKYELAEQYCQAAIKANPSSAQAFSNLGIIYDSQNRLYEAIKAYKASLELDERQGRTLMNLASTYMRQNRLPMAINAYRLAARQMPESSEPLERMGACYFHMRDLTKARESYEKAVQFDPKNAFARRGLGAVYMSLYLLDRSRKRTDLRDNGLGEWNASLEIDPEQPDLVRLIKKYSPKYAAPKL